MKSWNRFQIFKLLQECEPICPLYALGSVTSQVNVLGRDSQPQKHYSSKGSGNRQMNLTLKPKKRLQLRMDIYMLRCLLFVQLQELREQWRK